MRWAGLGVPTIYSLSWELGPAILENGTLKGLTSTSTTTSNPTPTIDTELEFYNLHPSTNMSFRTRSNDVNLNGLSNGDRVYEILRDMRYKQRWSLKEFMHALVTAESSVLGALTLATRVKKLAKVIY